MAGRKIRLPNIPSCILELSQRINSCRWSNPEGYTRILIPKSLQADVLQQLHYARQRAEECKLGAKGSVFWVNINRDKEEMVKFRAPLEQLNLINN